MNNNMLFEILNMLDWNKPSKIQNKGIKLAQSTGEIWPFIQPLYPKHNKNVWDNCAIIIADMDDDVLKPYLIELLEWLQDMNWPGASCIFCRLQRYLDGPSIDCAINTCMDKARLNRDKPWEDNLNMLVQERSKHTGDESLCEKKNKQEGS